MLHKMKTGGLKMFQKGPNFKNFKIKPDPFGHRCGLHAE